MPWQNPLHIVPSSYLLFRIEIVLGCLNRFEDNERAPSVLNSSQILLVVHEGGIALHALVIFGLVDCIAGAASAQLFTASLALALRCLVVSLLAS